MATRVSVGSRALFAIVAMLAAGSSTWAIQTTPPTPKAATELDGVWIVQSAERNGQPLPLAGSMRITFKGDKATFKGFYTTPTGDEGTYVSTVDATAKPKALTLKMDAAVISTVYELTGDTLRLVLPRPGAERPSKVSSEGTALFTLKKSN